MNFDKFANRKGKPMGARDYFAVLIPLISIDNEWHIIYELRSMKLNRQPGEVSFPGGKVEDNETFKEAAIRETMEELNLKEGNIQYIGELDYNVSYSNSLIYPFLGKIVGIDIEDIIPNEEVDNIFTVPLEYFLNNKPSVYNININMDIGKDFPYKLIPNGKDYPWDAVKYKVPFYNYNDYIIWGRTANITEDFVNMLRG